ncbi:TadE/TadG family type IV pilus assembly protein [Lichenihabitans sp. Uapishka_5]|uniref:TadE/TadG family type IV pilus assembly protein n=1 Tax=Lichenihabitans sp. Uapishka_5 TaxID=3037302 RepID=UPI0029E80778|nr:TadE/TadG family type IV pilus assembly protein [Lichenihabitans sp. Uapishka_5]MDX7951722.1 TadE/TadG family type IV pilus assembly protein [Lichenihabitans sp. Uapishka_5]
MANDLATDEDGAALVEAALVLPIVLLLVFGLTEVSFYVWTRSLAVKAVQLGARQAVVSSPVAIGPGLDPVDSMGFWNGLTPGLRCFPAADGGGSPCPGFQVRCGMSAGCACKGEACGFTFSAARLQPILRAVKAVLPDATAENIEVSYATNGLGYAARPGPVPVDVEVRLVGFSYHPLFLGDIFGQALPITASAILPGESLSTR